MFTDPTDPMDLIYTTDDTTNYDIACGGPNGPCLFPPGPNRRCHKMFTDPMDPMDLIYTTENPNPFGKHQSILVLAAARSLTKQLSI